MQYFLSWFQDFYQQTSKPYLLCCTLFAALLIVVNYRFGIEPKWLHNLPNRPTKFIGYYLLYLAAFAIPYLLYYLLAVPVNNSTVIIILILLAPAVFAIKVTAGGWKELIQGWHPGHKGWYLSIIADWPLRLLITVSLLFIIYSFLPPFANRGSGFLHAHGLSESIPPWGPYVLLLALMIPLVAFAATQSDFLNTYPKLRNISFLAPAGPSWWQKLLYELSYGSDFLTIEIFFRGFLVVLISRYVGPAAILPMAVFYCSIHFGKPLLECISSYFGGMILGIIACYSHSIWGGILIHLGLAWMMEIAATVAITLRHHEY